MVYNLWNLRLRVVMYVTLWQPRILTNMEISKIIFWHYKYSAWKLLEVNSMVLGFWSLFHREEKLLFPKIIQTYKIYFCPSSSSQNKWALRSFFKFDSPAKFKTNLSSSLKNFTLINQTLNYYYARNISFIHMSSSLLSTRVFFTWTDNYNKIFLSP